MKRYTLLLLALFVAELCLAQDTLSTREQGLKQTLNMNAQDFKAYRKTMRDIQKRILQVHKDSTLSFDQKKAALLRLHSEKETYIGGRLSPEQQNRLAAFNKNNERHSEAFHKHQQEVDKRKKKVAKPNGS